MKRVFCFLPKKAKEFAHSMVHHLLILTLLLKTQYAQIIYVNFQQSRRQMPANFNIILRIHFSKLMINFIYYEQYFRLFGAIFKHEEKEPFVILSNFYGIWISSLNFENMLLHFQSHGINPCLKDHITFQYIRFSVLWGIDDVWGPGCVPRAGNYKHKLDVVALMGNFLLLMVLVSICFNEVQNLTTHLYHVESHQTHCFWRWPMS